MGDAASYSIFDDTMADMTYPEVEQAARDGALVLWGLGVIEEHGPHLPLGTDVYLPSATLRLARRRLEERGIRAIIAPAFYWGVNNVTGSFAGSFTVRPETMRALMVDVFQSLAKDGFQSVFCFSGQGDALHNQTMADAIRKGRVQTGIRAHFVISSGWAQRLGFDPADPQFLVYPFDPPRGRFADVHAGNGETSMAWAACPGLVRESILRTLPPTNLGPDDLEEWRRGWANARKKTPLGYLGDPAAADPERGRAILAGQAALVAEVIAKKIESGTP
ncbi:MAG TPA: creatininase family protein [Methylomirabilota bacterium]|jgi:creatinine amidohydrolase|nr:creatininase family protein [Methylomirabilota bacterium]